VFARMYPCFVVPAKAGTHRATHAGIAITLTPHADVRAILQGDIEGLPRNRYHQVHSLGLRYFGSPTNALRIGRSLPARAFTYSIDRTACIPHAVVTRMKETHAGGVAADQEPPDCASLYPSYR
jgi:hypothetical protein